VCLYHSVDECIQAGRKVFEPGGAHLLFDKTLDKAVRHFLRREHAHLRPAIEQAEQLAGLKPWPLQGRATG
jgi:uncharacterized protein